MFIIWGKRTYGKVHQVGTTSVQTVFGHLYYLPLFPMSSHYVDFKTGNAYQLTSMNGHSILCGYARIWMPLVMLIALVGMRVAGNLGGELLCALIMALAAAAWVASYVMVKKVIQKESAQVREMMHRHFGVGLDPYHCQASFQGDIDERVRAHSDAPLEAWWYKSTLDDAVSQPVLVEMAMLRARCDQQDRELQARVLKRLSGPRRIA